MSELSPRLYWKLSGFYFFYFASTGALIPYLGLFLQSQQYSPQQIATVFAILMGTKIVAPNIWGWLADKQGRHISIIRFASLLSLLSFCGVMYSTDFFWIVTVIAVYSFFWNANLPQFEVITLSHLGKNTSRYSRIRLWGSLGFVILVALLGPLFEQSDVQSLPYIVCLMLLGVWLFSLITPDAKIISIQSQPLRFIPIVTQPVVIIFFILVFLQQISHGAYYAFYSIYLEMNGYSRTIIGQFWALGVISEIIIFLIMHKLLIRWRAEKLLFFSLILTSMRWLLIANFADSFAIMLIAQLFHAASFGIFHASAIHLVHQYFPSNVQGRGQALYSSLSFGAGGALGAIYSGYTWEALGSHWTFTISALIGVLSVLIAILYLKSSKMV